MTILSPVILPWSPSAQPPLTVYVPVRTLSAPLLTLSPIATVKVMIVIVVCSVLFCSVLFCSVLFCSVLFCSVLFCSVLFCSVLFFLFCSVLFCSVLFCSVLFCSVLVPVLFRRAEQSPPARGNARASKVKIKAQSNKQFDQSV